MSFKLQLKSTITPIQEIFMNALQFKKTTTYFLYILQNKCLQVMGLSMNI